MAADVERDRLFVALTRPQMFAGVTYSFFVINLVVTTELFLIFHSIWAVVLAIVIHLAGVTICALEPRFFDLFFAQISNCPRVKNYAIWRCNSYRP